MKIISTISLLLLFTGSYAQLSVSINALVSDSVEHIRLIKYNNAQLQLSNFPVNKNYAAIKLRVNKPEIIGIWNSFLVVQPGDSLSVHVKDFKVVTATGINDCYIKMQAVAERFVKYYFDSLETNFSAGRYHSLLLSVISDLKQTLMSGFNNTNASTEIQKLLLHDIEASMIYLQALPLISDRISPDIKEVICRDVQHAIQKFAGLISTAYHPDYETAVKILYIDYYLKESHEALSKIYTKNKSENLRKIISKLLIDEKRYMPPMNVSDEKALRHQCCDPNKKSLLCQQYEKNLLSIKLPENFGLTDIMEDSSGLKISLHDFLSKNGTVTFYCWATWCKPCVTFIKNMTIQYLKSPENTTNFPVFLSLDNDPDKWKANNLPQRFTAKSFFLEKGFQSNFAKVAGIRHVPIFIKISPEKNTLTIIPETDFKPN